MAYALLFLFLPIAAALLGRLASPKRFRNALHSDLDHVLMHWSPVDPLTVRQTSQNIAIFGKSGSGKSSGSGDAILRALVRYRNTGGLILASKPEDKNYIQSLFKNYNRSDDLYIMEPGGGEQRFN